MEQRLPGVCPLGLHSDMVGKRPRRLDGGIEILREIYAGDVIARKPMSSIMGRASTAFNVKNPTEPAAAGRCR
jgi:hypothetical protein